MDIEQVRNFCLTLPHAKEDFPFDDTTLVFRIGGKIFAMMDLEDASKLTLKSDPNQALTLRDKYSEISGAWHMNKKYWNQLNLYGQLSDTLVKQLIRHSYSEVVKKFPKRRQQEFPNLS